MGNFGGDRRGGGFSRGGRRSFDRGGSRGGGFGRDRGDREMFKAVCSNCGKECQVPFRPTNGKPVYCSDCFEKMGDNRSEAPRFERNDKPQRFSQPQANYDKQFESLNAKLDRLIDLLAPKIESETKAEESPKPKKVKKTAKKE